MHFFPFLLSFADDDIAPDSDLEIIGDVPPSEKKKLGEFDLSKDSPDAKVPKTEPKTESSSDLKTAKSKGDTDAPVKKETSRTETNTGVKTAKSRQPTISEFMHKSVKSETSMFKSITFVSLKNVLTLFCLILLNTGGKYTLFNTLKTSTCI